MDANKYKTFLSSNNTADKIFLLEKLTKNAGFFTFDNNLAFVTTSLTNQKSSITTKYVEFIPNTEITSVFNYPSFDKGFYDFLILKEREDDQTIESFIKLCDLYAKNPTIPFDEFIASIVDLFQLTRAGSILDCIGLFGELILLKKLFENGIDLTQYWHLSGTYSKYDISLPKLNIEVKTSVTDSTSFKIKHSQIFNGDNNIIALVSIRTSEMTGASLEETVNFFKTTRPFCENLRFIISLEKELQKKIEPDTFRKRFSLNDIYYFDCAKIATIEEIPYNISNVTYDYSFDLSESFDINELINKYLKTANNA